MNISPDIKAYVDEKIRERGKKESDRLQADLDGIDEKIRKNAEFLDGYEDRDTEGPDCKEDELIRKELKSVMRTIKLKIFPVAKERLAKIGWKIEDKGLDFLLLNDLDGYSPEDAFCDERLFRHEKNGEAKRKYQAALKEEKRLKVLRAKAEAAGDVFAGITGGLQFAEDAFRLLRERRLRQNVLDGCRMARLTPGEFELGVRGRGNLQGGIRGRKRVKGRPPEFWARRQPANRAEELIA